MLRYNICLIRRRSEILLLNREKASWMGCWNGIGGKLEPGETPRESMVRELAEETGIEDYKLYFKGMITWDEEDSVIGGMYIYLADVPADYPYITPLKTREGILDWKRMDWIMHPDNSGIASNIPKTLPFILNDPNCYEHYCTYEGNVVTSCTSTLIDPQLEQDEKSREAFFLRSHGSLI